MTGAGVSMSTLGIADGGANTLSEMLMRVSQISQAVEIPLIATGYGVWQSAQRLPNYTRV